MLSSRIITSTDSPIYGKLNLLFDVYAAVAQW